MQNSSVVPSKHILMSVSGYRNSKLQTSIVIFIPFLPSVLCGDLTYVILFPQLLLVLYFPPSNTYGSSVSFIITFILRILCGDKYLGIPQIITFGEMISNDCSSGQCSGDMPFRTIIMIIGLVSSSKSSKHLIDKCRLF